MLFMRSVKQILPALLLFTGIAATAQKDLPTDYLLPQFHKGRREAARAQMPEGSVMAVFAHPSRTYANDVSYNYHQNPDLYYFTGYKEPNAVLLLFKEPQKGKDSTTFTELFFVQKKDALSEQWTGRRLGTVGVMDKLAIKPAYEGDRLARFPLDFSLFKTIIFDELPADVADDPSDNGDLYSLLQAFRQKAGITPDFNQQLNSIVSNFIAYATPSNLEQVKKYFKENNKTGFEAQPVFQKMMAVSDSAQLAAFKTEQSTQRLSTSLFKQITGSLREIKTPEELALIRRAVEISCNGQNEVMKTLRPDMSELEIQGLHEYIHKKYGAESIGYGSIIGAGENGCILHYVENSRTRVGNEMLLMDVGAEYHGYTADVTRTIPADGKFSSEEKAIYQLVYDAQEAAFKLLKDGAKWSEAGKAAKAVIADGLVKLGIIKNAAEVEKYYPHGLSHHIGLDVHDKGVSDTLRKGMVITIEPGIYIPDNSQCDKKWWGIAVRIEDDALIRENDYELLSYFAPRSVEAIEKMMAEKSVLDNFKVPELKSAKKAF
jgi:Xaa-Pro aminopeptidase